MRLRHYFTRDAGLAKERQRIERSLEPSARDLFPALRERLLASRPIIGDQKPRPGADGVRTPLLPVYGKPTFRNALDENGRLV